MLDFSSKILSESVIDGHQAKSPWISLCTTTHPVGCDENVRRQIEHVQSKGEIADGPKRVLVLGSSTGYGLASRITAAFGSGASTIGVFFEKEGNEKSRAQQGGTTQLRSTGMQMKLDSTQRVLMAMRSRLSSKIV